MENRIIRIIDSYYRKTLLEVEDGGWITVDGKPYQLHYLDETHFQINGECWHRDQFRVRVIEQGRIVAVMREDK
jgi:hypothetical protein